MVYVQKGVALSVSKIDVVVNEMKLGLGICTTCFIPSKSFLVLESIRRFPGTGIPSVMGRLMQYTVLSYSRLRVP